MISSLAAALCALLPGKPGWLRPAEAGAVGLPAGGGTAKKHILIITGSAWLRGGSDLLAEAFARGAREVGHEVAVFRSAYSRTTDGFDTLEPMLEQADMLVLCSPLYWHTFSTRLKSSLDKVHACMGASRSGERKLKIREAALLMGAECWFRKAFDGPVATYQSILGDTGWKDRGMILANRFAAMGAAGGREALDEAEKLGREA